MMKARRGIRPPPSGGLLMLGWREWLALPELGIPSIRVKVDSGARSSALHVDAFETFERNGAERVRFSLQPGIDHTRVECESAILDRREVTDSGGRRTERIFIRTLVSIGALSFPIEVNLTSRRDMLFPMLLGRTAMAGRCTIDPSRSFVLGERE